MSSGLCSRAVSVSDATQHAFGTPDSPRIVDLISKFQPLAGESQCLVDPSMLMIGFPKRDLEPALHLPRAILSGLLNSLLQRDNRLGDIAFGQIGSS